ncbi:hypothetical protein FQN53_006411 [Emmonsiellopsis sp. PD_33]|nr:hypothetical protein FQN53_006411 [Emmonsiellopsis sp. PD_33]
MHSNLILTTALAAAVAPAAAFWRLPCQGRLGVGRIDPLVNPGELSSHAHVIHGASNFGLTVDEDMLLQSDCTSCAILEDKSAYWTPGTYFQYANGTTELVPQVGGMLVYYLLYGDDVQAFPKGFRMLAGDPYQRNFTGPFPDPPKSSWTKDETTQFALSQKAVGYNCLNYKKDPEPSIYRHTMPSKAFLDANCPDGVRMELMFPSCWNGKDLDTKDHKSHMAYPSLVNDGVCPEGFETRLVSLFYETIWDTGKYKGVAGKFVLANGDPTGPGYHADFIEAWEPGFLEQAVKTCTNPSGRVEDCPLFTLQSEAEQRQCKFSIPKTTYNENCELLDGGLPGGVEIFAGPGYAKKAPAPIVPALPSITLPQINIPKPIPTKTKSKTKATSTSAPPPPPPPAPTPTTTSPPVPAYFFTPEESDKGDGSATPIATSWYTKGNVVYELVIVQEQVTTTIEVPAGATPPVLNKVVRDNEDKDFMKLAKRHGHRHGHAAH